MLLLSHLATVEEQQGRDVTLLTLIAASMETASVFNISSAQRQHSALKRLFLFDFVCLVSKKKGDYIIICVHKSYGTSLLSLNRA